MAFCRIRKTFLDGAHVAMVGEEVDLTFPVENLGAGPDALAKILKGSPMLKRLKEAQRPAVIVGPGVLNRPDSAAVLQQVPPPANCHVPAGMPRKLLAGCIKTTET